ncbi:hypothetical protein [Intestinibacter sp.]
MKKKYIKPGIVIEDFKLSQSISAGCGAAHDSNLGGPTQWSISTCAWDAGGAIIWTESNAKCNIKLEEDADGFGVCYNNVDGGANIFGSY